MLRVVYALLPPRISIVCVNRFKTIFLPSNESDTGKLGPCISPVVAILVDMNKTLPLTFASLPVSLIACSKDRSEEHTSELQSRPHLVCRLLLEKKKKIK